ncbi:hypothetical protein [Achromobacter dolens]|uniref:hypothetical protein n=1 Tax=Achromobacter dolens TaxID=1287738 RepID=UPI0006C2B7A3|nr:hypothetical protein [Achromobacter dolens]MCZ8409056.1 hypothetical protein [Achromobacter dolens]CAB3700846.1 hypothetical protein LMG26840_05311 [Achromobacter dolens]CUJ49202.1 Uncharacterised protein [Achromobacter dolens]
MITPKPVEPSTMIGNAAVSLTPPQSPCCCPSAAANADLARPAPAAPGDALAAPRRRPRLSVGLWLALLLWAMGSMLLVTLNLAARLTS